MTSVAVKLAWKMSKLRHMAAEITENMYSIQRVYIRIYIYI